MFQNVTLSAAQEVREISSGVTPCIDMQNYGVLYHQLSSFTTDRWTKVVLHERGIVCSVYRLPWRFSVVQYCPITVILHNEHHLHSTLCRANFLWTRRTGMLPFILFAFQLWFVSASPGFVHSDDSSKKVIIFHLVPVQQGLCDCITVPLLNMRISCSIQCAEILR